MFQMRHVHSYRQWVLWFTFWFGLVVKSTAFALVIPPEALPSDGLTDSLVSTLQKKPVPPGRKIYPDFTPNENPIAGTPENLQTLNALPTPDGNPEAPGAIRETPPLNYVPDGLSNEELQTPVFGRNLVPASAPTLSTPTENPQNDIRQHGSSVPRSPDLAAPDVIQDEVAAQLIQNKKHPNVAYDGWPPINQATITNDRVVAVISPNVTTKNQSTATLEGVDENPTHTIGFMVDFSEMLDTDESEESAIDNAFNRFYDFLSQLIPSGEIEEFQDSDFTTDSVDDEQLNAWLQHVMVKEDVFRESMDGKYSWYFTAFPAQIDNLKAGNLGEDPQITFNSLYGYSNPDTLDPLVGNYNNRIRSTPYPTESYRSASSLTESPDKPNKKAQYNDNDTAKRSFLIKLIDYISNSIRSFKIWLHQLINN